MVVPRWLAFLVAFWVIAFGLFRIYIAFRGRKPVEDRPSYMRKGLYARSPRTHVLYGAVYLLLGGYLVAMGLGYTLNLGEGCHHDAPATQSLPASRTPPAN